jgi:ParB/RepB/Spo0J family partition protein
MTAVKSVTLPPVGTVGDIPLSALGANPLNPRKTFDAAELGDLAASLQSVGLLQPLVVRDASAGAEFPRYEIVAGHRRFEAAKLLGLASLTCSVRSLSDAEAADLALIDNLQRADVPAIEEAEAFGELLARYGSIEAVAAKVGKDVAHVAKRLKLLTLTDSSREALRETLITIDHALLLARLGDAEQDAVLKWCLDTQAGAKKPVAEVIQASVKYLRDDGRFRQWEPESVVRLREHIEQSVGRKLSRAPWSLDDAELLPAAGACSVCPANTKANVSLFADLDIEEATCSKGECFDQKREAFVRIKLAATGGSAVKLSWKQTATPPRMVKVTQGEKESVGVNLTQIFKAGQWVEAKKGSCIDVRAGVTVDWSDDAHHGFMNRSQKLRKPGEAILVCVAAKCKAHRKEWEKPKSESSNAPRDSAAEKAKEEKRRAEWLEENKLRMAVASAAIEPIVALGAEAMRWLIVHAIPAWGREPEIFAAIVPGFKKVLNSSSVNSAEFAKAAAVLSIDEIAASEYNGPAYGRDTFLASIKRLGYKGPFPWDKPKAAPVAKKAAVKTAAKKPAAKPRKPVRSAPKKAVKK